MRLDRLCFLVLLCALYCGYEIPIMNFNKELDSRINSIIQRPCIVHLFCLKIFVSESIKMQLVEGPVYNYPDKNVKQSSDMLLVMGEL